MQTSLFSKKKWFGAHVSAEKGPHFALMRASHIGANALALFTKNQRRWHSKEIDSDTIAAFKSQMQQLNFIPEQILPHGSYLINLGSPNPEVLEKSFQALCDELKRVYALGLLALNIHPGSSLGVMQEAACLKQIAELLCAALKTVPTVRIILENTAGQGSNLGYRLEHLAEILTQIPENLQDRIGVCIDTCHAFAAGYDFSTLAACAKFFQTFDDLLGFKYLKGMHLNDSKGALGSRLDRHESLGEGKIGLPLFEYIAKSDNFCHIPLILETPDPDRWAQEISWLKAQV